MTILVTGGCGFIGSNFVLDWTGSGDEAIVNLDKLTYAGNPANLRSLEGSNRYHFVKAGIEERSPVRESGRIDQAIDAAEAFDAGSPQPRRRPRVSEISGGKVRRGAKG